MVTDGSWKTFIPPPPPASDSAQATAPVATTDPNSNWYLPDYDDAAWPMATVIGPYTEVTPVRSADSTVGPGRYLRKAFTVKPNVAKASFTPLPWVSTKLQSMANESARINSRPAGPTSTARDGSDVRCDRACHPRTNQRASSAIVSDGWFAGRIGWAGLFQYSRVGNRPLFNANLKSRTPTARPTSLPATHPGKPAQVRSSARTCSRRSDR